MKKRFFSFLIVLLISLPFLTGCNDVIDFVSDVLNEQSESRYSETKVEGMEVHFIDVGQADSALIRLDGKNILIDAGDWNGNEVVPYLENIGVETIDIMVGSHEHADHIGQMDKVIEHFDVGEVWLPGNMTSSQVFERLLTAIDQNEIDYYEVRAGEEFEIDQLHIEIVSPKEVTGNLNNDSIVMKLTYGEVSFLFTGDAEKKAEATILDSGVDIHSTILKVGHHGSDTSSTDDFIAKINPEVAVISVGEGNTYNHPARVTLDKLKQRKVDVYATKTHGNVIISTDGESYHIETDKEGKVTSGD